MRQILRRSALAFGFIALVSLDAAAQSQTAAAGLDLSGRWQSKGRYDLVIDITRCSAGWCGVIVEKGGACGFRGLELAPNDPVQPASAGRAEKHYKGAFQSRANAETFAVGGSALAAAAERPAELHISGTPVGRPAYSRRIMLLNLHLVRAGEAQCGSDRPVS